MSPVRQPYFSQLTENRAFSKLDSLRPIYYFDMCQNKFVLKAATDYIFLLNLITCQEWPTGAAKELELSHLTTGQPYLAFARPNKVKTLRKISDSILKLYVMKELSFEQMEEVKGGLWCVWGTGFFYIYTSYLQASMFAGIGGYQMSYCIY